MSFAAFAHDVTVSGTTTFAALDGSASDHDGTANGIFTVSDGNLTIAGTVNCNDDTTTSACSMAFSASGDIVVSGALYAENRSGGGTGGNITLTAGRDLALGAGAIVSTASKSSSGATGGSITANVSRNIALADGSTIDAGSANAQAGAITIAGGGLVSVDGNVLSGPSRTILAATRLTGAALDGGTSNQTGGQIHITSSTFAEPALLVGSNANIVSQGDAGGAGPVILEGCGIAITGHVAALGRKDSATKVSIRSGKDLLIDSQDLGVAGATLGRNGRVRSDATSGTSINRTLELLASETITILGPASGSSSLFPLTSLAGVHDSKSVGGLIRIVSTEDGVNASGNVADDGRSAAGDTGGPIDIAAKGDVNLATAVIRSFGDTSTNNPARGGGSINVRSYSGNVSWTGGLGDVRPTGSASGLPTSDQGTITLTACGTVTTTGSSFPVNGSPTGPWPAVTTGACSPAAPSLPAGVVLVTCNTPPVANDASASTNEDTTVTIVLSGTDADGDSLTFSIVSGPSNGVLGPIIQVTPNSATVDYTPNDDFNGSDSFVYQANDGNGGTDTASVAISVAAVNDPPSFLAGPDVISLEDAGAQTFLNWVTDISAGPADESGQTVTFTVTNDNPSLFSVQPAVDSNGTLTYTANANAYGSAELTIVAQDNGGIANGGDDTSDAQTADVTVTPVNDEPSFTGGGDVSVNEDSGAYSQAWATGISAGPNESGQVLTFNVSTGNAGLFASGPSISDTGVLSFTLNANANGTSSVTVTLSDDGGTANGGDDTSDPQSFTITVNAVNDAPSFTSGGDVTVNEDSGAYSAGWATDISAGPTDESGQTVSFNVSNTNSSLFSVQPSISSTGVLTFTVAANQSGTATVTASLSDDGGTANGGDDTSDAQTFTITVSSVNDEPSFTSGGDVTVNEDSSYSAPWATGISSGPGESDNVTFVVSTDNAALFASGPSISSTGVLSFTLTANANGLANVTVYLMDDGGTANGGDDTSPSQSFVITVNAVNDAPSFTGGGDVSVNEDSAAYSAAWATDISAGPADESGQTVTFNVSNNNNALFSVQPSIDASGVLTFQVAPNAFGSALVTVTLSDNGGTANGGDDTSNPQTFTINVNAVNDEPSFTAGGNVSVNEDSGPYSQPWASDISAGPGESGQVLTFNVSNNNNSLFLVQPSISSSGQLSFTPAPNQSGTATVTVSLSDNGGTANGGDDTSGSVTFTITVQPGNDGPTAGADGWETFGNTEIRVDLPGGLTPKVVDTTANGNGVLSNDSDPDGDPIVVTGISGCADVVAPFDCTFGDGSVLSMLPTGQFSWTPGPGVTSGSFTYQATDIPAFGSPATTSATVTFTIHQMIWYVNGSAVPGGNGTSVSPLDSFASLNGAGDIDDPGAYIFVHTSIVNGGIGLEANQKLWGEGVGLMINQSLNGNGSPTTLVSPGVKPHIAGGAGTAVSVSGVSGVDIAGLQLSSTGNDAIDITSLPLGPATGATIRENTISGAALEGIDVNGASLSGTTVSISNTGVSSTGVGVAVSGLTGTVTVVFDGSTVTSATSHGMSVVSVGSPVFDVTVNNSTFANNPTSGLLTNFNLNTSAELLITGNTFRDNNIGLDLGSGDSADTTVVATGNTFLRQKSNAVNVVTATTSTNASQFVGTFDNNIIGDGSVDSGSRDAFGIAGDFRGDVDAILQVNGNNVRNTDFDGIFIQGRLDADADAERGRLDLTLRNNTVGTPDDNSAFPLGSVNGVRVESRNTFNLFLDIAGNTAGSVGAATHFRVRQLNTSAFNLERFTGAGNSTAAVAGFVAAENAAGSTASATLATTFTGVVSGTTRKP